MAWVTFGAPGGAGGALRNKAGITSIKSEIAANVRNATLKGFGS